MDQMLSRGARVTIQGLNSRADLNGLSARVVTYIEEKGRYKVRVDKTGDSLSVKPENIVVNAIGEEATSVGDMSEITPVIKASASPAKPQKSNVKMKRALTHNAACYRPDGVKQAGLSRGRIYVQTSWDDDSEMVEEYDPSSDTLLVRKTRKPSTVGKMGQWIYEVGEDVTPQRNEAVSGMMSMSSSNPIFLRIDSPAAFEWRVRNLMWPSDVYNVSIDHEERQIVIRTSNKKYFKRFDIGEMDALGLALEESSLQYEYAHNTLLVKYQKPAIVLDYEKDKSAERRELLAKAQEDGRLEDGPVQRPGDAPQPQGPGDCKQQ